MVGGNWNNGSDAGLWYFNGNYTSGNRNTNIGARHLDPTQQLRVGPPPPLGENYAAQDGA